MPEHTYQFLQCSDTGFHYKHPKSRFSVLGHTIWSRDEIEAAEFVTFIIDEGIKLWVTTAAVFSNSTFIDRNPKNKHIR